MEKPPIACRLCGRACGEGSARGYCKECQPTAPVAYSRTTQYRANDKAFKLYHTKDWFHFRDTILLFNPICMHFLNYPDLRCTSPATVVHHLLSPRTHASMSLNPANVVATCAACHAGGKAGELQGRLYSPTFWYGGESFPHVDSFGHLMLPTATNSMDSWLRSLAKQS